MIERDRPAGHLRDDASFERANTAPEARPVRFRRRVVGAATPFRLLTITLIAVLLAAAAYLAGSPLSAGGTSPSLSPAASARISAAMPTSWTER